MCSTRVDERSVNALLIQPRKPVSLPRPMSFLGLVVLVVSCLSQDLVCTMTLPTWLVLVPQKSLHSSLGFRNISNHLTGYAPSDGDLGSYLTIVLLSRKNRPPRKNEHNETMLDRTQCTNKGCAMILTFFFIGIYVPIAEVVAQDSDQRKDPVINLALFTPRLD